MIKKKFPRNNELQIVNLQTITIRTEKSIVESLLSIENTLRSPRGSKRTLIVSIEQIAKRQSFRRESKGLGFLGGTVKTEREWNLLLPLVVYESVCLAIVHTVNTLRNGNDRMASLSEISSGLRDTSHLVTSSPEFGLILSLLVACQVRRSHVPRLNGSSWCLCHGFRPVSKDERAETRSTELFCHS